MSAVGSGRCLTARAFALRAAPLRVASLRASIAIAAALSLTGCKAHTYTIKNADEDANHQNYAAMAELAATAGLSGRLARVALSDGRLTLQEASVVIAESKAAGIEARRAATGTGAVHESPVGNAEPPTP